MKFGYNRLSREVVLKCGGTTRTVRKSDYTPALAFLKHRASILIPLFSIPLYKSLSIYITNSYPTLHIVFVILYT